MKQIVQFEEVDEDAVVADLATEMSYEEVAAKHQTGKGTVWRIAVRRGARKHEHRIQERAVERKKRQLEFLEAVVGATEKADVLDFLDGVPDGSVKLHVTSIPYNIGKRYGDSARADSQRFHFYLGWVMQVLSEMARTLAQGGVIFLQVGSTRTDEGELYPLDCLLFQHLQGMGLSFQNRVVWVKPHGLTPKQRLAERHETALVFSKGPIETFNPTPARSPQKHPGKRAFKGPRKGELSGHPLGAWPVDVWSIPAVTHGNGQRTGHPAQFPEELARRAVLLYTLPGDLVCDVFMGSGTTAVAATQTDRPFIGCDLFYHDLARERLSRVAPDLASRLPGVSEETVAVWNAEVKVREVPERSRQERLGSDWMSRKMDG